MQLDRLSTDPIAFLDVLVVPTSAGPRRFGDVMAPFQREAFAALAPSLIAVANGETPPIPRFWLERTKGASKDSDLACCLLWLLAFSPHAQRIQVAANDSDQADEIRQIIKGILRLDGELNQLLASLLDVLGAKVINRTTESTAEILTRDAMAHGARPSLLIVNELSHILDEEYAATMADNLDKMPAGLGIIATNAGFLPSWQEKWKAIATSSPRWWVQEHKTPAPWIAPADLEESQRRNSNSRFLRLWRGIWCSSGGDAIDENLIMAACTLSGPTFAPADEFVYYAGCDLGLKKDSSAVVVLGRHVGKMVEQVRPARVKSRLQEAMEDSLYGQYDSDGEPWYKPPAEDSEQSVWQPGDESLHLCQVQVFRPAGSEALSLSQVERALVELHRVFRFASVYCDQWQAALLVERLQIANVPAVGIDPTGPALRQQAQVVIDLFAERRIRLYRDPVLLADVGRLRIEEKSYGVRLSAARSSAGEGTRHADSASAFALACLAAHRSAGAVPNRIQGPLICYP